MRVSRVVPVLAAGALLVASTSPVRAQEVPAAEGVGTTTGSLTLLGLDAGDLLILDLLSDGGTATTDGTRSAAAQIAALSLDSVLAPQPISVPLLSVESTGDEQTASQDVGLPANPVASGSALPLSLSALVGDDGARSSLTGQLADLDVLGGILSLTGANAGLGSTALVDGAAATRGVQVQDLELLDLESLLAALGIELTDLPLDTLLGLLDQLGLLGQLQPVLDQLGIQLDSLSADAVFDAVDDLLDQVGPLLGQVDTLTGQIAQLTSAQGSLSGTTTQVCTTVLQPVIGLLPGTGTLTQVCTDVPSALSTVEAQITNLQGTLTTVRATLDPLLAQLRALLGGLTGPGGLLDLLGGVSLLSVDGLDVSVLTKATDDLETSVAEITADLGTLQVGELSLPGLDLTGTVEQVTGVLGQVEAAIGQVLGEIAPSLSDLVSVRTLQEQTSVEEGDGRITSTAELTGLVVEVQPILGELQALLAGLGGTGSLGAVLEQAGLPIPASGATEVLQLNGLLAGVTDGLPLLGGLAALDQALTLQVASVRQQSVFGASAMPLAPSGPGTPGQSPAPTLPRTGSSDTIVLALAAAAVLAALGGRQLLRRSAG
jgi:hypothetical protein